MGRTGNDRGDPAPRDGDRLPGDPARRDGGGQPDNPDALQLADRILALQGGRLAEVTA